MKASERATARGRAKLEARKKATDLFKQKQKEKAMERAKEIEKKKTKKEKTKKIAPNQEPMAAAPSVVKTNPFEEDLGVSNPFDEDQRGFSFGSDEGNPFLADIKAAASATSAASGGANPFYGQNEG